MDLQEERAFSLRHKKFKSIEIKKKEELETKNRCRELLKVLLVSGLDNNLKKAYVEGESNFYIETDFIDFKDEFGKYWYNTVHILYQSNTMYELLREHLYPVYKELPKNWVYGMNMKQIKKTGILKSKNLYKLTFEVNSFEHIKEE